MTDETGATQGLPEGEPVVEAVTENPPPAAEQTTETETQEPVPEKTEDPEPKKTPWFQKRIDDLTREKWELRRQLEATRAGKPEAETRTDDLVPKSEIQRLAQEEARRLASEDAFNRASNDAYDKGKAAYGDWDEALRTFQFLGGLSRDLIDAALATDAPHQALYALGKDPDRAVEIMGMPPARMGAALAKLASAPAPKPKAVSAVPPPIKPVDGGSQVLDDPEKMTMDQWVKWRERQIAAK